MFLEGRHEIGYMEISGIKNLSMGYKVSSLNLSLNTGGLIQ